MRVLYVRALIAIAFACCVSVAYGALEKKTDKAAHPEQVASGAKNTASGAAIVIPIFVPLVQEKPAEAKPDSGHDDGGEFWPMRWTGGIRIKIGESFLVLFTLLLWWSTRALVKDAKKSSAQGLRAYVSVDMEDVKDAQGAPEPGKIGLKILNCGKTPAYALSQWCGMDVLDFPLAEALEQSELPVRVQTVMNPDRHKWIIKDQLTLTTEQAQGLKDGTKAIYLWGCVTYRDAFKKKSFTEFAYVQSPKHHGNRWAVHETHNKAT